MNDVAVVVKALPYIKLGLPYLKLLLCRLWPYEIRVEELSEVVNILRKDRIRVENFHRQYLHHEDDQGISDGREYLDDAIKWLEKVGKLIYEYKNFRVHEDCPYAVCSYGYLPKPGIRRCLHRVVTDITRRVNLLQLQNTDGFSNLLEDKPLFEDFWYEWFESRLQTMENILAALEDSNVGIVGVYGLCGVGKTTLIKEVAEIVKCDLFDVVVMMNVTSSSTITRIQGQIAEKLGMKLEEESESGRAARLRERLKNPKEKILIILDNNEGVKLDFSMLGIGSQIEFASNFKRIEDSLTSYTGCKLLMISHTKQLLLSQMNGKEIKTFCVKPLTEDEAEAMMFKTMAEIIDDGNSLFKTLAAQIAKKCEGLPMTIVTIGKALKNQPLKKWEDAYQKLERQDLTAKLKFSTRLSYNLLENQKLKDIFLICARLGPEALITDLVRYCIGLGFLQLQEDTARKARDSVYALVGKLKESSMLSDSFSSDRFTMQDIIRDEAFSLPSQQTHAFSLTERKLDQWPHVDQLKRYTAISLHHCDLTDIIKEFPIGISCPRLRVFHLDNKDPLLRIPDEFFNVMKELQVLKLTGIHLSPLPSSIKYLKKLRMLCLERCKLGEHLSIIGDLEELRVLSLSGSDIEYLPVELRQLAKLQTFDISNCFNLEEIPAEVLSSLTSLEELCLGNSPIQWRDEGQGSASLSELRQLNQLASLDIKIPKITDLPQNLFFDKLDTYRIVIGDFNAYPQCDFKMLEMSEASRYLAIQVENGFDIHKREDIKVLFEGVEKLLLGQLNDVEDIVKELNFNGFPYLKCFSIARNSKVKYIINSENQTDTPDQRVFPKLESLFLYEVNNMEHICYGQLTDNSFCKLKIIKLKICGHLKNVFFSSMIKHLSALETIEVSECSSLKEIVTMETQSIEDQIEFPELRSLMLQSLPEFIGFYTSTDVASTGEQVPTTKPNGLFDQKVVFSKLERMELSSIKLQKIWNDDRPLTRSYFQNLIHLDVNDCPNLRYLLSISMSKSLMNLQRLFISECGMMESIFIEIDMIEIERTKQESIFPNLKSINMRSMEKLKKIWHNKFHLHSFGKLDALIIEGCDELASVFPSYMVGRFQSLCNLKVTNCKSMKEIFDLKGCGKLDVEDMTSLQNVHVEALPNLVHVWNKDPKGTLNFKSLKNMWVQECHNLKHIFPVSVAMDLKKLEYLEVEDCDQLKEIVFMGEAINVSSVLFEFPKLTTARFSKLLNLRCFYGGKHELHCSTLNSLSVDHCHKLMLFRTETTNPEIMSASFMPEKVICNLKSMQIEPLNANFLKRCKMNKLEELHLSGLMDAEILYSSLRRHPNLKSVLLSNCSLDELTLVPPRRNDEENYGAVPMLISLKLMNLPSLTIITFSEDTLLFRRLQCLILKECPCLNTIEPSSESFTNLTYLEVSNCNELCRLMSPSTAKSLVRLTTMKVIQCESMKTIVSDSEQERERIVFKELKEIELNALHKLESFCTFNHCGIEFPSLEKIVLSKCDNMERFASSKQVMETPNLRQICVRHGKEEKILYWEGDLNATIERMYKIPKFLKAVDKECNLELQATRQGNIGKWLRNLVTLKLHNCVLPYAIPSSILPLLINLKELEVRDNNRVEVIFYMNDIAILETTFQLRKLTLKSLSKLAHVWEKNSPVLIFGNLQEVVVSDCENLQTLLPASLAKNFEKLEKLKIESCCKLQGIIEKEEGTPIESDSVKEIVATERNATSKVIKFGQLKTIVLHSLPSLICFYPGSDTMQFPSLINVRVWECPNMMIFSHGVIDAESFHGIQMSLDLDDYLLFHQDLNATVKGMFQRQVKPKSIKAWSNDDDIEAQVPIQELGGPMTKVRETLQQMVTTILEAKPAVKSIVDPQLIQCMVIDEDP